MRNILYIFEQTMQQLSECLLLLWQHACEITEIYEAILKFHFSYQIRAFVNFSLKYSTKWLQKHSERLSNEF